MLDFTKNGMLERLNRLDEDAALMFDGKRRFKVVIVGGSALVLLETLARATHDIDVLSASAEIMDLLERYDINTQVNAYSDAFAYNLYDRLVPVKAGGKQIDFYTASLEDIIVAKLHSVRDKDLQDITSESVLSAIDWNRLEHLATAEDEAKASALNDTRHDEFLVRYRNYVERWKPCEN